MASKGFSGQVCVYCGVNPSTRTGDHVIARSLLLERYRGGLPEVPCCTNCNKQKSDLEHYLSAILPFGSRHPSAAEALELNARRLEKNNRLKQNLAAGIEKVIDPIERQETISVPFESEVLEKYASLVSRGLLFHEFGERAGQNLAAKSMLATASGDDLLLERLGSIRGGRQYSGDFGNGSITMQSLTTTSGPLVSIWRFQFFGILMSEGEDRETGSAIWTIVASLKTVNEWAAVLSDDGRQQGI